eukprot:764352-Hanusia_phi.AAC.1
MGNADKKCYRCLPLLAVPVLAETHDQLQGVGRKSQLSDIFSAPLELAKKRMDEALGSGHKNPCLASADSSECSKHWAADYMAKADESISGEITAAPAPAGDVSVSAMVSALKAKLAKMKQEFRLIRGNFEHGPPREMRVKISPRGPRGFTGANHVRVGHFDGVLALS